MIDNLDSYYSHLLCLLQELLKIVSKQAEEGKVHTCKSQFVIAYSLPIIKECRHVTSLEFFKLFGVDMLGEGKKGTPTI